MKQENIFPVRPTVSRMVEEILGCKWSLAVLAGVHHGICRPGALKRAIGGISTKVLNERLRKLVRYGVLDKQAYPEIPPRVEYVLTPFGRRFLAILEAIEELEVEQQGRPD